MRDKTTSRAGIAAAFHDGMTVMIGGFLHCGTPFQSIEILLESGAGDLHLIVNDAGTPDMGIGRLIAQGRVSSMIASHIGRNPQAGEQSMRGALRLELCPQGSLYERIRAGGAGLGGVLTPTGIGTPLEEQKRVVTVDGRRFILETPLVADVALIRATTADTFGNCTYRGATKNMNPAMAMAARLVICEAGKIVVPGALDPDLAMTPGVVVDMVFAGGEVTHHV